MASLLDSVKNLDLLAEEKNLLTFGNPNNPRSREMWKTPWGGCFTLIYSMIIMTFLTRNMQEIVTGEGNTTEIITIPNTQQ